jgi:thioredoxin reductase (NADPH)
MSEELYDVIIIGGGPAGLTAAQYASRANLKTIILDRSPTAGALAYSKKIENYPGLIEPVSGTELLDLFRRQAIKFGAEYCETQVVGVQLERDIKEVTAMDRIYTGKTVIIATGSMGRKPAITGEEEFLGRGVSYCATCDAAFYRDQVVCVVGSSEETLKEADALTGFAAKVYLFSPAKELNVPSGHPSLSQDNIHVMTNTRVLSIEGSDIVERLRIRNDETGQEQEMQMDGIFIYLHGTLPVIDFLDSSVDLGEKTCVVTHGTTETSIPGVFAAGDVTCSEVRQVVVASSCGCVAALSAEKYIYQKKRLKHDWAKLE